MYQLDNIKTKPHANLVHTLLLFEEKYIDNMHQDASWYIFSTYFQRISLQSF